MCVWVETGEVSVIPYTIVTAAMPIRFTTCFITSTGQGEPPIMPVRRDDRSKSSRSGRLSSARNIAGTPSRDVHRSCSTAARVAPASKNSAG